MVGAGRADLAVDVGPPVGVVPVEGHGVERGRQAGGGLALGQELEAAVRTEGVALAGEHPGRVLVVALEREHAGGEGERAGQVLAPEEPQQFAVVGQAGQGDARDAVAGERLAPERGVDLAVADLHHELVGGVPLLRGGPGVEQGAALLAQLTLGRRQQFPDPRVGAGLRGINGGLAGIHGARGGRTGLSGTPGGLNARQEALDGGELLAAAGHLGLGERLGVVAAHRLGDLGQVADPGRRHDGGRGQGRAAGHRRQQAGPGGQPLVQQQALQMLVEGGDPGVVVAGGDRAEHRHVVGRDAERGAVAYELAAHVAQGVLGPAPLVLVDHHGLGEVEHVDLLQLRRRPELGRHDVDGHVDVRHDARVALADARGLHDDQVVPGRPAGRDDIVEAGRHLARGTPGGQRAEVGLRAQAVHPDAVAEQRPAAAPAGGVDRDDGDAQLVVVVHADPAYQLVGERRLAGAAGAGDAEHRGAAARLGGGPHPRDQLAGGAAGLQQGDRPGQGGRVAGHDGLDRGHARKLDVALLDQLVDHAGQAEALAVLGREDAGDATRVEQVDLVLDDDAAAPAVDLDVARAALAQQLDQVGEELDVAALVRADRHALDVFLDGGGDDLVDRAVVTEVDDLGALRLKDAPHDVDRRVMAIEQRCGGHETDWVRRNVHA
jgi:hypothetical protein